MKKTVHIDILVGLPGSGKSYYCTQKKKVDSSIIIFDFDKYKDNYPGLVKILKEMYCISDVFSYYPTSYLIFDGLFTTNAAQEKIISEWFTAIDKYDKYDSIKTIFNFVYFNGSRETCLHNDSFRDKERSAAVSIKQMPLEKPDVEYFKTQFKDKNCKFKYTEREIYKMTTYDKIVKENTNDTWSKNLNKNVMVSETWCTGGTWCSWDGMEYQCEPEQQPLSFRELDELLEKICPNITLLQYKRIMNNCVEIQNDSECDYYGGRRWLSLYVCDLDALYNLLWEMNYITK